VEPAADGNGGAGDADLARSLEREHQWLEAQRIARLGSWTWDVNSGGVRWSDGLYRVFGLKPDEFVPSYSAGMALVDPADRPSVETLIHAALIDGFPCAFECQVVAADGTQRRIRCLGVVHTDSTGSPDGMHGTAQDITDVVPPDVVEQFEGAGPALYDSLTGLAKWHLFADRAAAALGRAIRERTSTALLVIDIDRFHRINDQFGHESGDRVLVDVGRRLDAIVRPYDAVTRRGNRVARLGNDEFMVLCENVPDRAAARALCRRVTRLLEAPVSFDGGQVVLTAGIGVALAPPGETNVEELITHAESAMRRSKHRGLGAHTVFTADMVDVGNRIAEAGRALEQGFKRGELRLHYQPKLALDSDRIVGVEALLRWEHPDRGTVGPDEFIPVAEATGLILPIGTWVIEHACREGARWRAAFPDRPALVVSVNVSPRQFGAELVEVVARTLATTGTEPASLCLEVTESLLMDDIDGSVEVLRELAGLGVAISIDDFGTGYSSLSYLKQFPLHELKIDRSFIEGLGRDDNDTAIVAAVVAMAHALDLVVVAEGVETAEQLQRLRTLGCEQAQGYYFARPGPASDVDALLMAEADASWRGHAPDVNSADGTEHYRSVRVLVVDDSPSVRELAALSLAAVGFEVHEAANGSTALSMAAEVVPDCVLLDVDMPDMSGLEACRALRASPMAADCTILMLTANDDAEAKVEAFSAGADDYVLKPFSPRDLAGRVNAALRRRREASGNAGGSPLPGAPER
jgi:diguanylate cyclase (GGDEF)-like protein